MEKYNEEQVQQDYKIIAVANEEEIIDSLSVVLKGTGYQFTGATNPVEAVERIKNEHFDLLLLDFIKTPYQGEQVVEEIREFNKELYILLLIGHKDLVPPIETIKKLNIQGYCEKNDNFGQLLLLIESGIETIKQKREILRINDELSDVKDQLERAYLENIQTLRYTVEAKDTYTRGHSDRVSEFAVLIGENMGLSKEELKTLKIGGLFHDIGKIGISDSILLKESKLSDDEYSEIKHHQSIGADILSNATIFKDIIPIVKYHHERFDGRGYPENLKGEEIPLLARITSVADAFDAMSSTRTYRNNLELEHIKNEFRNNKGTQFDPKTADIFLEILDNEYDKIQVIQDKYRCP